MIIIIFGWLRVIQFRVCGAFRFAYILREETSASSVWSDTQEHLAIGQPVREETCRTTTPHYSEPLYPISVPSSSVCIYIYIYDCVREKRRQNRTERPRFLALGTSGAFFCCTGIIMVYGDGYCSVYCDWLCIHNNI